MTRQTALAVAAVLFSVAVWSNFLVTTGGAAGAGLGVIEMGALRALVCGAILAPVVWRIGLYPRGMAPWRFLVMVIGAGVSFMFLIPAGFSFAPPADSGVFAPGALPLWVAILSAVFLGEAIGPLRAFGFALIAGGVFAVGGYDALMHGREGAWRGYLCFAGGSFLFSCYAIAQRGSGLSALEATALISVWCLPIAGAATAIWGVDFSGVGWPLLAWTAMAQFGSGVVAVITYTYAIIHLGPSRGSAFIALTPACVAVAADIFLDQPATPLVWLGVAVVSAGVLIASGVLERRVKPESAEPV